MSETFDEKQRLERMVNYFRDLTDDIEQQDSTSAFEWHLGFHMANRILYIFKSNPNDLSELKLLVNILKLGLKKFGSGWLDLYLHANNLLGKLSDEPK